MWIFFFSKKYLAEFENNTLGLSAFKEKEKMAIVSKKIEEQKEKPFSTEHN